MHMALTVKDDELSHVFHAAALPSLEAVVEYLNGLPLQKLAKTDPLGYPATGLVQAVESFQIFPLGDGNYDVIALCSIVLQ
jgi:hypothetical protein